MFDMNKMVSICSTCGGDCDKVCQVSGLPINGHAWVNPEDVGEYKARVPIVLLERKQREQFDALIDDVERVGAWFYTTDKLTSMLHVVHETPHADATWAATGAALDESGYWYSPKRLRKCIAEPHYGLRYYNFRWDIRFPVERLNQLQRASERFHKAALEFEREIAGSEGVN